MISAEDKVEKIAEVASDALNDWECGFIENMEGKTSFTESQVAVIDKIYDKVCDSPY